MEKNALKLNLIQKQVIFGTILGDAHFETQNNGITYRIKFEQSLKHKAYIEHLHTIFKDYVTTPPISRVIVQKTGTISKNVKFQTVSSSTFTFFGKQFYKQKKKIVPKLIHRWLTPRALAYWYMDDGSIKSTESKAVLLNTQSFSYNEVKHLCEVLKTKFNLESWPRKQKKETYQIYISGKSYEILRELIYEFLIPEMYYKFPLPRKKDLTKMPKK